MSFTETVLVRQIVEQTGGSTDSISTYHRAVHILCDLVGGGPLASDTTPVLWGKILSSFSIDFDQLDNERNRVYLLARAMGVGDQMNTKSELLAQIALLEVGLLDFFTPRGTIIWTSGDGLRIWTSGDGLRVWTN